MTWHRSLQDQAARVARAPAVMALARATMGAIKVQAAKEKARTEILKEKARTEILKEKARAKEKTARTMVGPTRQAEATRRSNAVQGLHHLCAATSNAPDATGLDIR